MVVTPEGAASHEPRWPASQSPLSPSTVGAQKPRRATAMAGVLEVRPASRMVANARRDVSSTCAVAAAAAAAIAPAACASASAAGEAPSACS